MTEASENDFKVWMTETARHFEWYADSTLPKPGREPRRLIGAMRYAVLGGGKGGRALLGYAAGAVSGGSPGAAAPGYRRHGNAIVRYRDDARCGSRVRSGVNDPGYSRPVPHDGFVCDERGDARLDEFGIRFQ